MIEIIVTLCLGTLCKDVNVSVQVENPVSCVYNSQSIISQWKEANLSVYGPEYRISKFRCKV